MPITLIDVIDTLGTFVFAVSGATAAMQKRYDWVGLFSLAFITAIGGGTIRDLLIGNTPVTWMTDHVTIAVIIAGALVTPLFYRYLHRLQRWINVFDALGLGLFTIVGINKGLDKHLYLFTAIALGTITGTFGGLLRDVIINEHPVLFTREIYAVAAILGGIVYISLIRFTALPDGTVELICVALIVVIRLLSLKYKWELPRLGKLHSGK